MIQTLSLTLRTEACVQAISFIIFRKRHCYSGETNDCAVIGVSAFLLYQTEKSRSVPLNRRNIAASLDLNNYRSNTPVSKIAYQWIRKWRDDL